MPPHTRTDGGDLVVKPQWEKVTTQRCEGTLFNGFVSLKKKLQTHTHKRAQKEKKKAIKKRLNGVKNG